MSGYESMRHESVSSKEDIPHSTFTNSPLLSIRADVNASHSSCNGVSFTSIIEPEVLRTQ